MNIVQSDSAARPGISAWKPLRQPVFRALWIASLTSNIGTWMQNVGAAWLMTSLTPSPVVVALVQAATSLPVFLVGLPAGALADKDNPGAESFPAHQMRQVWANWPFAFVPLIA